MPSRLHNFWRRHQRPHSVISRPKPLRRNSDIIDTRRLFSQERTIKDYGRSKSLHIINSVVAVDFNYRLEGTIVMFTTIENHTSDISIYGSMTCQLRAVDLLYVNDYEILLIAASDLTVIIFMSHTDNVEFLRARQVMFSKFIQSCAVKHVLEINNVRDTKSCRKSGGESVWQWILRAMATSRTLISILVWLPTVPL